MNVFNGILLRISQTDTPGAPSLIALANLDPSEENASSESDKRFPSRGAGAGRDMHVTKEKVVPRESK